MTGPFDSNTTNPLDELAQIAFERSLSLTQQYYRTISLRGQPLAGSERDMVQSELITLCGLYRAIPDVDRMNLGKDVEEIFLFMAEELLWVDGDEGPEDGLLADEVLRVFLGATTIVPLRFMNEWPDDDVCGNWGVRGDGRNRGGQRLTGSVIWLDLPRRRTERCGCTLHGHISHDVALGR